MSKSPTPKRVTRNSTKEIGTSYNSGKEKPSLLLERSRGSDSDSDADVSSPSFSSLNKLLKKERKTSGLEDSSYDHGDGSFMGKSGTYHSFASDDSSIDGRTPSKSKSPLYPNLKNIEDRTPDYGRGILSQKYTASSSSAGSIGNYDLNVRNRRHDPIEHNHQEFHIQNGNLKKGGTLFNILIAFLVIAIFFSMLYMMWPLSSAKGSISLTPFHNFVTQINQLEQNFPNQNRRLWKTVKASVIHILNTTHSEYPAVILIASQTQQAPIASCIASLVAAAFQSAHGSFLSAPEANIDQDIDLNEAQQKKKLDEAMKTAFSNDHKSFVIRNLHSLLPGAALLLHGYCDNDNAPYKDVMILFTLHVNEKVIRFSANNPNSVEDYLQDLWTPGLDIDKVKAIMSRVANNIVIVEEEADSVFSHVCA